MAEIIIFGGQCCTGCYDHDSQPVWFMLPTETWLPTDFQPVELMLLTEMWLPTDFQPVELMLLTLMLVSC